MPRPRFSLRTLLVVMTALCAGLGWLAYSLKWTSDRREFSREHLGCKIRYFPSYPQPSPPGLLFLFGEESASAWYAKKMTEDDLREALRLFPESEIYDGP